MRVLVACEFSGIVRDAFIEAGHDAVSCDLLPTESPGPHIQGDVRPLLREPWDLVIAHPPCNYLTAYTWSFKNQITQGAKWWSNFHQAAAFFAECLAANAPLVAVENPPLMHPPARSIFGRPTCQMDFKDFGSANRKKVGWWLKGLPPLMASLVHPSATSIVLDYRGNKPKWKPSHFTGQTRRSKERATFQPGMARALAQQWGSLPPLPIP